MKTFPKRVVILGSNGFIGGNLLKEFSSHNNLLTKGLSSHDCDLLSADEIKKALADLTTEDVLIMAAAVSRLKENSFNSMTENIRIVENVTAALIRHPVGQMFYLSSADVYGISVTGNIKINEKLTLDPNDYYAISKVAGEFLLKKECAKSGIPLVILRLSGVYGPGGEGKSAVNTLILSAVKEKKIYIYGKGDVLRDYIYVEDIYKVINTLAEKRLSNTINVATGESHSIIQIVEIIKSLLHHELKVEFKPKPSNGEKRAGDMIFDCTLLRKELPNLKMTGLKKGISVYLANFLSDSKNG